MKSEKEVIKKIIDLAKDLGKRQAYLDIELKKPISSINERAHEEKVENMKFAIGDVQRTIDIILDTVF